MLKISPDLSLPVEAVTETFVILAKRGKGKTYTAAVMVEEMVKAGLPVAIVDPVGVWWGLRSSADGKAAGLPVVIFGGEHADVPLEESAGTVIADVVVEEHVSAVLDLSLLSKGASRRFMTDFAERLYHRNREPLHLVIDEADAFAPQRVDAGGARLLGAVEDLVRRGRARGLGVTLITQRPAVLNKDVLTQAEVLVALGMTGVRDVAAIDEWVRLHADEAEAKAVKDSLPSLPTGTAWIWSPGWLNILKRVQIRKRATFDSSATPKVGERRIVPQRMAEIDLAQLGEKIAASVEHAQKNDPVLLKRRLVELQAQLEEAGSAAPREVRVEVPVPVVSTDQVRQLEEVAHSLIGTAKDLHNIGHEIMTQLTRLSTAPRAAPDAPQSLPQPAPQTTKAPSQSQNAVKSLPVAQRKILTALAQHPQGRNKTQVALLTGYSAKGGGFNNTLSALRSSGYLSGGTELMQITDAGRVALGDWEPLPRRRELLGYWMGELGKCEASILRELYGNYPRSLSKEELAQRTGYEASGGGFNNALSRLRTLELLSGDKSAMKISEVFFE